TVHILVVRRCGVCLKLCWGGSGRSAVTIPQSRIWPASPSLWPSCRTSSYRTGHAVLHG
ncbi:UNVERIFIED_CONTAM: hypothetical protein Sradi_6823100, partial [Sesamum radiatum]